MPARCSVYIDAGYLLASAATRVTGTSLRSGIHVEFGRLVEGIRRQAESISGMPVLRVYWYDSARNAVPDIQQQRIGELPRVKLRLGRFGIDGQQKGVDLRLGLDLVTHARNKAADVFLLVSGDDDFTEAVEEAQAQGVEVVLLAAPDGDGGAHAVSRHLRRAADELYVIDGTLVDEVVLKVERPATAEVENEAGAEAEIPDPEADQASLAPQAVTVQDPGVVPDLSPGPGQPAAPCAPSAPEPSGPAVRPAEPGARPHPSPGGTRPAAPEGAAPPTPKPGPARSSATQSGRPEPVRPAAPPKPAGPPVPGPPVPVAPRTPKDIAGAVHRLEGDGVPLPPDGAVRAGTWAEEFRATVTAVVGRVLNSLALSSTPLAWRALDLGRPSIPREVDKALLLDVTAAMGVIELSDLERHEIREAFWESYDALVAAARA